MEQKVIIGKEEWCAIPALGLPAIKARVDTGAKTSALHAFNIVPFDENGRQYVKFDIHPIQNNRKIVPSCRGLVVDRRSVKSSSGEKEQRLVIKTPIIMGNETWDIEITLTNRDSMGYRMLIGREAMKDRVLIDPDSAFCLGHRDEIDVESFYNAAAPRRAEDCCSGQQSRSLFE